MASSVVRWTIKPIFHCHAKPFTLGPCVGLHPQRHSFPLGIPTCWYLKTLRFALPPTQNIKVALPTKQNPNASQWNIGCVGYPTQNVGHTVCSGIWALVFVAILLAGIHIGHGCEIHAPSSLFDKINYSKVSRLCTGL